MAATSVTLLFPGQGSQYVGMGKKIGPSCLQEADEVLNFSLSRIMSSGSEEDLAKTSHTQPAVLLHSLAFYRRLQALLQKRGVLVERVLGHSVGEYAALVAAGSLGFKDALKAVHLRGIYMQEAAPLGTGKMAAILNASEEVVAQACRESSTDTHKVMPANYNTPRQIVISGHREAVDKVIDEWPKQNGHPPFKARELKVSAPFHSSLMTPARDKLGRAFEEFEFKKTNYPYIANKDAREYPAETEGVVVKQNLLEQVTASVLWTQSISRLSGDTLCIECGPGRILQGLVRKINPDIKVISLDKEGAWQECEEV